jgi:hypothetical protein
MIASRIKMDKAARVGTSAENGFESYPDCFVPQASIPARGIGRMCVKKTNVM